MGNYTSYPWALLWGFYYYLVFQLIFLVRFGSLNISFSSIDRALPVIGILSVVLLMYFADKLQRGKGLLFIPFLIALPFSVFGALGGGLLGAVGMLIFGLVPFVIALPIGYWLIKKFSSTSSAPPPTAMPGM